MTAKQFEKIQNPQLIKKHLMLASLYLAGYELLKSSIVDDVKGFFITGYDGQAFRYSADYDNKVLEKHKKVFEASCLWLAEVNAISQDDVKELQRIREHRDKIAHDLPTLLVDDEYSVNVGLLRKMKYYIDTIGKFWVRLDIDIQPDIYPEKIDDADIRSGRDLLFEYLISIVDAEKV